ncbi:MAG: hypothetical protein R3B90_09575 [Planctomycetaceae bacterium]
MSYGIPGKDVFGRVLAALDPQAFQAGVAVLVSLRDRKEATQMRYFISSLGLGVNQFAQAVRSHWSIQHSLHWSLDVTCRERE